MTRQQLLKNVRQRISYYGRQGYVFADFRPEELSTQKLVALQKLSAPRFLSELSPMVKIAATAAQPPELVTLSQFREYKYKEGERERLLKSIQKRTKTYSEAGFGFQDLSTSDLVALDTRRLAEIANMSRKKFIGEFGTTYSYQVESPFRQGLVTYTITAQQQLEVESAERAANLARAKVHQPPLNKNRYFTPFGVNDYIKGLRRQAAPGYFKQKRQTLYENFFKALEHGGEFLDLANWLHDQLKNVDPEKVKDILDEGIRRGTDFNILNVYYNESRSLALQRAIELFGLDPFEGMD